jgi:hypothetical protein
MSHTQPTALVLWGDYFDEAAAVRYITERRKEGLRVKLVAVHSRCAKGMYGIKVTADLTVEEALEQLRVISQLFVPCAECQFAHMSADPRIERLLNLVREKGGEVLFRSVL